jgi:hypothetical protein
VQQSLGGEPDPDGLDPAGGASTPQSVRNRVPSVTANPVPECAETTVKKPRRNNPPVLVYVPARASPIIATVVVPRVVTSRLRTSRLRRSSSPRPVQSRWWRANDIVPATISTMMTPSTVAEW